MRHRAFLTVLALLACAGCRNATEREAAELAGLRDDATAGIDAVEAFCTARDSAIARAERHEPGTERVLREVLLAPVVIDDYCEEFRFHEHDDEADSAAPADHDAAVGDTVGHGGGE